MRLDRIQEESQRHIVVGNVSGLIEHRRAFGIDGVKAPVRQTDALDGT
jgi:hypothetical protein